MNQEFGNQALDQIEKLFKGARVPENVQALAQQGVTASKDFYSKTAEAVRDGATVMTEIADTAWGSTKMLNDKIAQNSGCKRRGCLQCGAGDCRRQIAT